MEAACIRHIRPLVASVSWCGENDGVGGIQLYQIQMLKIRADAAVVVIDCEDVFLNLLSLN